MIEFMNFIECDEKQGDDSSEIMSKEWADNLEDQIKQNKAKKKSVPTNDPTGFFD